MLVKFGNLPQSPGRKYDENKEIWMKPPSRKLCPSNHHRSQIPPGHPKKKIRKVGCGSQNKGTRWFKVTFSSPSWRSLHHLKESQITIPERSQKVDQVGLRVPKNAGCQCVSPITAACTAPNTKTAGQRDRNLSWSSTNDSSWGQLGWQLLVGFVREGKLRHFFKGNH